MMKYILLACMAVSLVACGHEPTATLYTLSSIDTQSGPIIGKVNPVTVGQIDLPSILDRNQLIRRVSADQIVVMPFDRWAAPLDDDISKTLTVDLEHLLPANALIRSDGTPYDTSVGIIDLYIDRFDADSTGHVTFDVAWTVTSGNPQHTILHRTEHITEDAGDGSSGAMVQAMSRAVADLSVRIAAQLPTH